MTLHHFPRPLPAEAPVDGYNLAQLARAQFEALVLDRVSPQVAIEAAHDLLADLSVAELFAQPPQDDLIKAAAMLAQATRAYAQVRGKPESDLAIRSKWHVVCYELSILVDEIAKRVRL